MSHRQISRKAVRELVAQHDSEMKEAVQRGENPHQLALDQQDAMAESHMQGMSTEERTRFFEIYTEETDALTAQTEFETMNMEAETQRVLAETEQKNQAAENIGKVIGAIVLMGVIWLIFSKAI